MKRNSPSQNPQNRLQEALIRQRKNGKKFRTLFVMTMVLLLLCVMLAGMLYLLKYSPDPFFLVLRDHDAPMALVHDAVALNGETYQIEDFVDEVYDLTDVTMSYEKAPDFDKDGMQEVVIRFTDKAGNYTDESLMLEVIHDTSAPVIEGEDSVSVMTGESISYKGLVNAFDDTDEEIGLEIDNSQVDLNVPGSYPVVYTAMDSAGNKTTKTVMVNVMDPDSDEYYLMKANELCDQILGTIITDDMDQLHKVWAVYDYVRTIPYVLTDYTRNYIREGYKLLSEYRGDCFGSYAAVRLLLERLGIDVIPVTTDERYTTHFWNMVSIDGGATWYHVDATHWTEWGRNPVMCMICDARINEISSWHNGTHIYLMDEYPATPPVNMPIPEDIVQKDGVYYEDPYDLEESFLPW